jgi:hypothetical protein
MLGPWKTYDGVVAPETNDEPVDMNGDKVAGSATDLTIRGWPIPSFANALVTSVHLAFSAWMGRLSSVEYATSIWSTASALSNGLTGT